MHEVDSWCTDSQALRAEYCMWAFHTIQPSSYVLGTSEENVAGSY